MTTTRNKLALPDASRGKTTWNMDPEDVLIPPKGHFLHDPESPTVASEAAVRRMTHRRFGVITVTKIEDAVYVLLGRERTLAAREVNVRRKAEGLEPIPIACEYMPCPAPSEAVLMMVNENRGRRKVTQVADARYACMLRSQGLDADMIAAEFECSRGTVRNLLALGEQPEFVLSAVKDRQISASLARKLEGTHADRKAAIEAAVRRGGAGAGKGRRRDLRKFVAAARDELGIDLSPALWKKLIEAWKKL